LQPEPAGRVPLGHWLWSNVLTRIYLRKTLFLDNASPIQEAFLAVQCDCRCRILVNGQEVAPVDGAENGAVNVFDLTTSLHGGENVIGIRSFQSHSPSWFSSALRAGLQVKFRDGTVVTHTSDDSWRMPPKFTWVPSLDDPRHAQVRYEQSVDWLLPGYDAKDWVTPPVCQDLHPRAMRRSCCFRKACAFDQKPHTARIHVTARGFFQLFVNGKRIGLNLLDPPPSRHSQRYLTFDIGPELVSGENVIGVILGTGWRGGFAEQDCNVQRPELLLQLHVVSADGLSQTIVSDASWISQPSPYLEDALNYGVRYDARLEEDGWSAPGFDASAWTPVEVLGGIHDGLPLRGGDRSPVRVTERITPVAIVPRGPGRFLVDFGQNAAGRISLAVRNAEPGREIVLRYAEHVWEEGALNIGPFKDTIFFDDHQADKSPGVLRNLDVYRCRGAPKEVFEPDFTYTGFRYVEIDGYPGNLDVGDICHRVIHSDLAITGEVSCGRDLLNRIWKAITYTFRSNYLHGPTDCPTREKTFYDGDIAAFASTACLYMDLAAPLAEWKVDGPCSDNPNVGWHDDRVIIPWTLYRVYGDVRILETMYRRMTALVDQRLANVQDGLFFPKGFEWGDHLAIRKMPMDFFCSAFHFHVVDLLSRIASILGRDQDASRYQAARDAAWNAVRDRFLRAPAERQRIEQGGLALALGFGLVNQGEVLFDEVITCLRDNLKANDWHLTTGLHSTPYLLPALSEAGFHEDAFRIATRQTRYSWGHILASGGTTMWESWDLDRSPRQTMSLNHFGLGSVGRWFFEYLVGIRQAPQDVAFRSFVFAPRPLQQLPWARASFDSVHGRIDASWFRNQQGCDYHLSVPANARARVVLQVPDKSQVLLNGRCFQQTPTNHSSNGELNFIVESGCHDIQVRTGS
jgi:alpha-L-rhamnosidase